MNKLSIVQMQDMLHKNILDCTENEIRFLFHIFSFDLKEFRQETGHLEFEVHYKSTYVIKISSTSHFLSFSNEWLNFGEDTHGISMGRPSTICEVINIFINVFAENVLSGLAYEVVYDEERSIFQSQKEAQAYLESVQQTVDNIINSSRLSKNK